MSDTGICECGAKLILINGHAWCAVTLARYRALFGDPEGYSANSFEGRK